MKTQQHRLGCMLCLFVLCIASTSIVLAHPTAEHHGDQQQITVTQSFSSPNLENNNQYLKVTVPEMNSYIVQENSPMLPIISQTLELPFKTKITQVDVHLGETKSLMINRTIQPAAEKRKEKDIIYLYQNTGNPDIYTHSTPYPDTMFTYSLGSGLNADNEHVVFLTLRFYPIQYLPVHHQLNYINEAKVTITYQEPPQHTLFHGDTELIIITPEEYYDRLDPLIEHKNHYGITTERTRLEDIYTTYPGRDNEEKIKYYIKEAVETKGTRYILLLGDMKKLPIRHTYASWWEPDILSDLYYADLFNASGEFCSWDENNNNLFGEIDEESNDLDGVDLFADVHVGRLACSTIDEVDTAVMKIIMYEEITYTQIWFKKIVLAGGDTFPPGLGAPPFVYEGEITNQKVAQQLPDFEHVRLWASNRNLNAFTFNRAINKGAGFVSYAGHGFEHGWGTYRPNCLRRTMGFTQPLYYSPFIEHLDNNHRLPIIFFDACLTAKLDFNVTDLLEYYTMATRLMVRFTKLVNDPSVFYPCFAWNFIRKEDGGAIAVIGATRSAYTYVDADGVYAGAGYLDFQFFKAYSEGVTVGEMLTMAQNAYITNVWPDYFTIEEYILLGDPSLRVGGYPS